MGIIKHNDLAIEMQEKRLSSIAETTTETDEQSDKINRLVRERYSLSQELCLHRKKLIKTVTAAEWKEYTDYVEECIAKVEGEAE